MKCFSRLIVLTPLLLCLAGGPAQSIAGQTNDSQNPLRDGMIALDRGYRDVVSAVALGDTEKVQNAALAMHEARGRIAEGLRAGTVVLPKNAQRDKEYSDLDRRFHDKLEALDRAARHNNQREMQRITQILLTGCVKCHQTFRK